jgi:predicted RNA-binding Zn-ribbon protein involved in translation (DUF1610 family)
MQPPPMIPETKKCPTCRKNVPIAEYGSQWFCKHCRAEYMKRMSSKRRKDRFPPVEKPPILDADGYPVQRTCPKCGKIWELRQFGHMWWCKECQRAYCKARYHRIATQGDTDNG